MEKDGHYYSKFLTEYELEKFKSNLIASSVSWLFDHRFESFRSFIGSGFYWDGSPEGHDYWATIAKRNVDDIFIIKNTRKHRMLC